MSWLTSTFEQPSRFFVERVAPDASPAGDPVAVSSGGVRPLVAGLGDGNFVLTWSGLVRPFGPDGTPLRDAVQVIPAGIPEPAVQLLSVGCGAFLVAWNALDASGRRVLDARWFASVSALVPE